MGEPKMIYSDNDIYRLMKKHGLAYGELGEGVSVEFMTGAGAASALIEMRAKYEAKRQAATSEQAKE